MTDRNDEFEHRLGQGLKRWAEAGRPTIDLEAYVTDAASQRRPGRAWRRWAVAAAAVALFSLGATFTFPAWAGTAAAWPLIGPVVQEIIMHNAGLKWAYDAGLVQGTVAEVSQHGITVRILAVVPDRALTTILYQITGLPPQPEQGGDAKPVEAGTGLLTPPVATSPYVRVVKVPGASGAFWSSGDGVHTPMGYYNTLITNPVAAEGGLMELVANINGESMTLRFPVSRSVADQLTRELPVGTSETHGSVTYTVDAVIQTPVQTVVRYQVSKPEFRGGYSWSGHEFSMRLEQAGAAPVYSTGDYGQDDGFRYALFPRTALPTRLVMPADVIGVDVDVTWPLEAGATRTVVGVPVTLAEWEAAADQLALRLTFPANTPLVAVSGLEGVDAAGAPIALTEKMSGWSAPPDRGHEATYQFTFPPGQQPVAIRATRAAVPVTGPWTFDLPGQ